jgi:hypothetical protein
MDMYAVGLYNPGKMFKELFTITTGFVDRIAGSTAANKILKCARVINTQWASHEACLALKVSHRNGIGQQEARTGFMLRVCTDMIGFSQYQFGLVDL